MTLEKGMVIYRQGLYGINKYVIARVTEKQAIIDHGNCQTRFDREQRDDCFICAKGDSQYTRCRYSVETEELRQKYERALLLQEYERIKPSSLTDDQLIIIIDTAKGIK